MSTSDILLNELIEASNELMKGGAHDGGCTNEKQAALVTRVPLCQKHQSAQKAREDRFRQALDQFKLLRDVFSSGPSSGL